ncbi:alpha-1,2-fucosyltransferase [Flavobacterium sp.]|uniref:alpha-1,2-fucosyltransferase n=1 Tax=Flavobacterium sp. TaxID=239 RepID=UPI002CDB1345|nr:alpha-1,2-fucosyltransferase [Flavobacterium sp.]HSD07371.1 alpha-1,2-fucosyltransferase [Flavobacterium sp.]
MVLIKLQGGLGNQMFQYAFASILAKKNNTKLVIEDSIYTIIDKKEGYTPRSFELSIFDNEYNFAKKSDITLFTNLSLLHKVKRKFKLNYPKKIDEQTFEYSSKLNSLKAPVFATGYFQSYKYFIGYEKYIKDLFVFPVDKLSKENIGLIPVLQNNNTIAIHIRRGDYVTDKVTNQFHGICSFEYYEEAILKITSKIDNPNLVFFSDDPQWVKENFEGFPFNKIFIAHNKGLNSWADMFLMSICSHNIIANSSFSWWGAWLNNNPEKIVVAPKDWFQAKDIDINSIIPEEWVII